MNDLLLMILVYTYLGILLGISNLGIHEHKISKETSRKLIHIFASFIWMVTPFFESKYLLYGFVFSLFMINYISLKLHLIQAIERDHHDIGTLTYPISLGIMVLISYQIFDDFYLGLSGMLILGFGDGLATLIGRAFPIKTFNNHKSLGGFLAMIFVSTLILFLIYNYQYQLSIPFLKACFVGLLISLIELKSKKGFDNLLIPLSVTLLTLLLLAL